MFTVRPPSSSFWPLPTHPQGLDDLLAAFDNNVSRQGGGHILSNLEADSDEAACPPRDPDEGCLQGLSKVVVARRSSVALKGPVCGLWLLEALQVRTSLP